MPRIRPTFEEFEHLAATSNLVPVTREILADTLTPVAAFAAVGGGEGSYLLESVVGGEKWARYSFVGFDPDLRVRGRDRTLEVRRGPLSAGAVNVEHDVDIWRRLRTLIDAQHELDVPWLPPFWGGAVGYVAYDAVRAFEPTALTRSREELDGWDFSFAIGGPVIVFDDLRKTARIVVPARLTGISPRAAYDDAIERIESAIARLDRNVRLAPMEPASRETEFELPRSSTSREEFIAAVERGKEHIRRGDVFQVVLSKRFTLRSGEVDAFDVYRALRALNPSPYMFFLRFDEARIAGASPEALVRLFDRRASVRPLAGTRPRGRGEEDDGRIEHELRGDPKELAEHVMLVDLGRNDLGRVCEPGSVRVTEQMVVERYSHVMHLTSNVEGVLAKDRDAIDLLRATFPAGTLSGAPKVRAMQIIDELEPEARGIYGGAVGYFGWNGNSDMAIAIRTVVETRGEIRVQAGAGIVEASDPETEHQEVVNKASAALLAIRAAKKPI